MSSYAPEIEYGTEIRRHLKDFQRSLLAKHTDVVRISSAGDAALPEEDRLDADGLEAILQATDWKSSSLTEVYFIYKYLMSSSAVTAPPDSNKLQISPRSFQSLISHYDVSAAFAFAVSRAYLPVGRGCRQVHTTSNGAAVLEFWYLLPIRVQVKCTDRSQGHAASTAGSNQMDPNHYLHLEDVGVDIRGATVAIFSKHNLNTDAAVSIVINFADGRWPLVADEPQRRVSEVLDHYASEKTARPRCFLHLVQLTSALRWWTNALHSVNLQLISYEKQLQQKMDNDEATTTIRYTIANRGLHSIAAHLQRYQSELNSIHDIAEQIQDHGQTLGTHTESSHASNPDRNARALSQILSQLVATKDFAEELEKKVQNILALLFNRMQITSDSLQISNGMAIQEILRATKDEARTSRMMADESRRLAREMKRDSVAMKAIAIVTMVFLPGASFAALLSMPFFEQNPWLADTGRFWVWIILTIPSTAVAFLFYWYWRKRDDQRRDRVGVSAADVVELGF